MRALIVKGKEHFTRNITYCMQVRYPDTTFIKTEKGANTLSLLENESPDLIFLGDNPNTILSIDLISKIREFSKVPLIVMIEEQNESRELELLEAGADDFVFKTFRAIDFLVRIGSILQRNKKFTTKRESAININ
jgi:two-component system, OmpR family, KDP operon response regulator KdpE